MTTQKAIRPSIARYSGARRVPVFNLSPQWGQRLARSGTGCRQRWHFSVDPWGDMVADIKYNKGGAPVRATGTGTPAIIGKCGFRQFCS
jgi:hypothetical protein